MYFDFQNLPGLYCKYNLDLRAEKYEFVAAYLHCMAFGTAVYKFNLDLKADKKAYWYMEDESDTQII